MKNRDILIEYLGLLSNVTSGDNPIKRGKEDEIKLLFKGWEIALKDYDEQQIKEGFEKLIKNVKYFPAPAELVDYIEAEFTKDAEVAWKKLIEVLRVYGYERDLKFKDKRIHSVLVNMGNWWSLCNMEERQLFDKKREFIELYNEIKRNNIEDHPEKLRGSSDYNSALIIS